MNLDGVGRRGQGWGRSQDGVPTCGSGSTVVGWGGEAGEAGEAGQGDCHLWDSHLSPSVEGTLSPPDLAGKLLPVVPAGIPLPVGPVVPVGPCGMTSPSDLTSIGLVSPITDPVGPLGPYVTRGPVGSYGMLSPCDSDHLVADGPLGPYVTRGPVGLYGMLSTCD